MTFIVPKPSSLPQAPVVVTLDFDGVLNRLSGRRGLPLVEFAPGDSVRIDVDLNAIHALDVVIQQPGISFGWLTTQGTRIKNASPLIGGRLAGGYVVEEPPYGAGLSSWKIGAARRHLQMRGHPPVVWIDDTEVSEILRREPTALDGVPRDDQCLVVPDQVEGLTLAQVGRTAKFVWTRLRD